jgi:uncharacterized membrane protein YcaP (DUF421 family)
MEFDASDLVDLMTFTMSPIELIVRGTLMYWFLFLIFRFILRRGAGEVGVTDFLFVVLLGDAAQNAMIGTGNSVAEGMVLVGTLVFWNYALDALSYQFPTIAKFTEPARICLVKRGRLMKREMRREYVTEEELEAKLREAGIDDLKKVRAMYLEGDGQISLLKFETGQERDTPGKKRGQ